MKFVTTGIKSKRPNNVLFAISVMQEAKNFDMSYFYSKGKDYPECTEVAAAINSLEELHNCGTSACFYGYLAVTPAFKKEFPQPFTLQLDNPSTFLEEEESHLAQFLGIPKSMAFSMIYQGNFYDKPSAAHVTKEDVIAKLKELL